MKMACRCMCWCVIKRKTGELKVNMIYTLLISIVDVSGFSELFGKCFFAYLRGKLGLCFSVLGRIVIRIEDD